MVLAIKCIASLHQLPLRGGESGLCRSQRVQLILWVEFRQHLIRFDAIANAGQPFDDAPADAEGQSRLVFGVDLSSQDDQFANIAFLDGYGPNRPRFWSLGFCLRLTSCKKHGESRQ